MRRLPASLFALFTAVVMAIAVAAPAQDPPIPIGDLAEGRYAKMEALIEKTFLGIDVYLVEIHLDPPTARAIERLAKGKKYSDPLASEIAKVAYRAENAYARIVFKRNVTFDQFITGASDNLEKALRAKMISKRTHDEITAGLPRWFAFLKERGIKKGEQMLYRAEPGSLRTVFLDTAGRELLDQTDHGADRRLAMLAGYFAPGTDSRKPLIKSLF